MTISTYSTFEIATKTGSFSGWNVTVKNAFGDVVGFLSRDQEFQVVDAAKAFIDAYVVPSALPLAEDPDPEPSGVPGVVRLWFRSNGVTMVTDGAGAEHELHVDSFAGIGVSRVISGPVVLSTPVLQEWTDISGFDHIVVEDPYGRISGDVAGGCLVVNAHPQAEGLYEANWRGSWQVSGGADKDVILDVMVVLATPLVLEDASNPGTVVVTRTAHGFHEETAMVIAGETGNTAINGSWVLANVTTNTFELRDLGGTLATGTGSFVGDGGITKIGRAGTTVRTVVRDGTPASASGRASGLLGSGDKACLEYAVLNNPPRPLELFSLSIDLLRIGGPTS